MNITTKDAEIVNTGGDDDFPGTFEVILSTPAEDRDGDTLGIDDWEQPLPGHITFDQDHAMNVAGTVGSGVPTIEDGKLVVRGTYSSLQRAQDVRTLVKEGHIRTTSVAFMTKSVTKAGKSAKVRELLNGAFVAVPSNREALVLASKSFAAKAGARNSSTDAQRIQTIHDLALELGASSPSDDTGAAEGTVGGKAVTRRMVAAKAVAGSYEQRQQAINDALDAAYARENDSDPWVYAYPLATFDDSVVYRVSGDKTQSGQYQADYTIGDDGTVTLGEPAPVNMVENVVPIKSFLPDEDLEQGNAPAEESADPAEQSAGPADDSADADLELELQGKALATRAIALAALI